METESQQTNRVDFTAPPFIASPPAVLLTARKESCSQRKSVLPGSCEPRKDLVGVAVCFSATPLLRVSERAAGGKRSHEDVGRLPGR